MDSQLTFWQWFDAHQDELFDFEVDQERIFDDLSEQLIRVHPLRLILDLSSPKIFQPPTPQSLLDAQEIYSS